MNKVALLFLSISLVLISSATAYAQGSEEQAATQSASQNTVVDQYQLPYPGILPDSPLYFLKVSRDRIISFLISDSLKKAEFDLLQAEKRLGGGEYLVGKKNYLLAESTFSKGLNYFDESVDRLADAKAAGKDIVSLSDKMVKSLNKHRVIFNSLQEKTPAEFNKHIPGFVERLDNIEKKVNLVLPKVQ